MASKRKGPAVDGAKKVKSILGSKKAGKMAAVCRDANICTELMKEIDDAMDPFTVAVKASQDAFTGSLEERDALDKAYNVQEKAAKLLTKLEEQMVPAGYKTPIPDIYSDLPQLQQRATVEMIIKKADANEKFDINGVNFPEARLKMVIDGYTCTFQPLSINWFRFCLILLRMGFQLSNEMVIRLIELYHHKMLTYFLS